MGITVVNGAPSLSNLSTNSVWFQLKTTANWRISASGSFLASLSLVERGCWEQVLSLDDFIPQDLKQDLVKKKIKNVAFKSRTPLKIKRFGLSVCSATAEISRFLDRVYF